MAPTLAHIANFFKHPTLEARKIVTRYRATFGNAA